MNGLNRLKVLFVVEGFTDIRFVVGLSEVFDLTMVVPARQYAESGLDGRVARSNARLTVDRIPGGRPAYQFRCLSYLWRKAREFDVILSQEALRGSLNSCVVGAIKGVPVATYTMIAPIEYFRWRRRRGTQGPLPALLGEALIRGLLTVNGRLATLSIALGPYLMEVVGRYSTRLATGYYYGVDTTLYRPASCEERSALRRRLDLPENRFVVFLPSRISHEKDPETVLRATSLARGRGLDAVVVNLGGGYREFIELGRALNLPDAEEWVIGRPAAHPMEDLADYYRAADCMALASLEEGLGMSPLEALACGTLPVCTAVGGMGKLLPGKAPLTPKRDPEKMADAFQWVAGHRDEARAWALRGRDFVVAEWNRDKAFRDLERALAGIARRR